MRGKRWDAEKGNIICWNVGATLWQDHLVWEYSVPTISIWYTDKHIEYTEYPNTGVCIHIQKFKRSSIESALSARAVMKTHFVLNFLSSYCLIFFGLNELTCRQPTLVKPTATTVYNRRFFAWNSLLFFYSFFHLP